MRQSQTGHEMGMRCDMTLVPAKTLLSLDFTSHIETSTSKLYQFNPFSAYYLPFLMLDVELQ